MPEEDNYGDGADATPAPAVSKPEGQGEDEQKEGDSQTALIATHFFGSTKPQVGDVCQIEVEKVMDGEVQVSYKPMDKTSDTDTASKDAAPKDSEMDAMMSDA